MQRISRAPELSATLSLDSCWINRASPPPSKRKRAVIPAQPGFVRERRGARSPSSCSLQHLDQPPALGARARRRFDDADDVALLGLVSLVVGVNGARPPNDLLVGGMAAGDFDPDGDRLVGLRRRDDALADLPHAGGALAAGRALFGLAAAPASARSGAPPPGRAGGARLPA